jgi:hypothetical protein
MESPISDARARGAFVGENQNRKLCFSAIRRAFLRRHPIRESPVSFGSRGKKPRTCRHARSSVEIVARGLGLGQAPRSIFPVADRFDNVIGPSLIRDPPDPQVADAAGSDRNDANRANVIEAQTPTRLESFSAG